MEKRFKEVPDHIKEKAFQVEKYQKYVRALKVLQDEVTDIRHALHDVLHHTIWDVLGVREQVVKQARRFYADVVISAEGFDPFKPASGVN